MQQQLTQHKKMSLPFSICTILLLCLPLSCFGESYELEGPAFHKAIDTHDAILVMFYAPWCPHCQDAKPKFVKAAAVVAKEQGKALAMVDCDKKPNQDTCAKLKIEGYPTFKLYSKGKLIQDYEEEISEKALVEMMKNPPKEGEKRPAAAAQDQEPSEVDSFMEGVTYLGGNNYTEVLDKNNFCLVFFYAPWCPHCKDSKPKLEAAAKELVKAPADGNIIAAMNCDLKENQKVCESEKVEGYPTVRLMKKREMWAEFEEEIEPEPLLKFIRDPPKEKVPPTPVDEDKKQEDSEKDDQPNAAEKPEDKMKNVKYLEGEQFKNELKSVPHALVKFYAPWCPHCVSSKPAFDAAAGHVAASGATDRILAAVNCDVKANEPVCEEHKVEGFPTFMLFSNGVKKQDYTESPITEQGVKDFMLKLKAEAGKDEL